MIQPEDFEDGATSKVYLWPQKTGKRMLLSTLKFPDSHWTRNLPKRTMITGQDEILLFIYVDDIQVMSKRQQAYERFRGLLKSEFKIKELGKSKHSLGVEFVKNGISLSQRQCIEDIVRTFSFQKKTRSTPQWRPFEF
jgi:hypothetical protein